MHRWTAAAVAVLLAAVVGATQGEEGALRLGEPFPDLAFESLLAPADYESLGVAPDRPGVRLSEIGGELLVLEFFNKYCLTCWRQAPQLQAFSDLLTPGDLGGRVRVLSVGAGNNAKELESFRREFRLTYALAADPTFEHYYALDLDGAPYTAFLLRQGKSWILADQHVGFYGDVELLARARTLLKGWSRPPDQRAGPQGGAPSAEGLREFLLRLAAPGSETAAIEVPGVDRALRAVDDQGRTLFAWVARREPVCDLCHPIWFLLALDDRGVLRGFEPVFVTKFGNELWGPGDAERIRARLVGRQAHELPFDPDVDAVTSATMSSALIFDEARRGSERLRQRP